MIRSYKSHPGCWIQSLLSGKDKITRPARKQGNDLLWETSVSWAQWQHWTWRKAVSNCSGSMAKTGNQHQSQDVVPKYQTNRASCDSLLIVIYGIPLRSLEIGCQDCVPHPLPPTEILSSDSLRILTILPVSRNTSLTFLIMSHLQ